MLTAVAAAAVACAGDDDGAGAPDDSGEAGTSERESVDDRGEGTVAIERGAPA
jgi:hypothetical protein